MCLGDVSDSLVGWLRRLKHGPHDGNVGWCDLNALGDQSLGDLPGERIGMLGKVLLDRLRFADWSIVFWHVCPPCGNLVMGRPLT